MGSVSDGHGGLKDGGGLRTHTADYDDALKVLSTGLPTPKAAPDFTDEALKKTRILQAMRSASGQGRAGTFLTGPMGDTSQVSVSRQTALGGQ